MNTATPSALKFVGPAWFSVVMGLAGLSLAWHRAVPLMGETAGTLSAVLGAATLVVLVALLLAAALRAWHHPQAWHEDLKHPVRHGFVAALPVSLILAATVGTALLGPQSPAAGLLQVAWGVGALLQWAVTVWVLAALVAACSAGRVSMGWHHAGAVHSGGGQRAGAAGRRAPGPCRLVGGAVWRGPAVLAAAAGADGDAHCHAGPVARALAAQRFIFMAPPAVVGLSLLQLGAPTALAWGCWGIALFSLLWVATLLPRIKVLAFACRTGP